MNDLSWLDSVGFFTIDLGLDRMRELAERLDDPQDHLKFIHAAGSNGKGSVCTFIENGLRASGFRTGFYSSPHLVRLEERFRINGKPVDGSALAEAAEKVHSASAAMREKPTYFELTTAIALVLFRDLKVDFAVWETGLGGRLDATNIVTPVLSVITGISLEHTEYLGSTLSEVAGEKAGIIKPGIPVVCGPVAPDPFTVIRNRADELHAPFHPVAPYHDDHKIVFHPDGRSEQRLILEGIPVEIPLPGSYQRNNAAVAAQALHILSGQFGFSEQAAIRGMRNAEWPARMQFVPERRLIIDGAHNPEGAEALARSLREFYPQRKFHFITGCFADKNADAIIASFAPLALDFRFIEFDGSGRKVRTPDELTGILRDQGFTVPAGKAELNEALSGLPASDGELSVLSGSLHMCGEALHFLDLL